MAQTSEPLVFTPENTVKVGKLKRVFIDGVEVAQITAACPLFGWAKQVSTREDGSVVQDGGRVAEQIVCGKVVVTNGSNL